SEEQQMLLETTRRFVTNDIGFNARRNKNSKDGHRAVSEPLAASLDRAAWQGFADLGLLALPVPEADGGLDGNPQDIMLVMQALGEGLVLEPYLASAVLATAAIVALGSAEQRAELLPALADGSHIAVLAHDEEGSRFDPLAITTSATLSADGYLLNGHKSVIAQAPYADTLLVSARLTDSGKYAVFLLPAGTAGVSLSVYRTVDDMVAADIHLSHVALPTTARLGGTSDTDDGATVAQVLDLGLTAVCAEAVGALDRVLAATVEYTRTRHQFGVAIASFQALQHRMADMVLYIEQARSMSYLAAMHCTDADADSRATALSAAKVIVGQACRFVGQNAVQLHGGMGVTDELELSHYFKRLMAIELQFGSTDWHLERYAGQLH
ncbi:MAG: acyl-CoA dehydrogenase family protein, partial [Herbaspirillum sp.]